MSIVNEREQTVSISKLVAEQQKKLIQERIKLYDFEDTATSPEYSDEKPQQVQVLLTPPSSISPRKHQEPVLTHKPLRMKLSRDRVPPSLQLNKNTKMIPSSIKTAPMGLQFYPRPAVRLMPAASVMARNAKYTQYRITKQTLQQQQQQQQQQQRAQKPKTPIVADVFSDQMNKLAPLQSQPMSARNEYFHFKNSNGIDKLDKELKTCKEDGDDVESWAIEEDAEFANNSEVSKFNLETKVIINGESFEFKVENFNGRFQDSKTVFLNKCAVIFEKYMK